MQRDRRAGVGPREPKKRFGQHFLEPAWVGKVLDVLAPGADETFVEIGPGRGALTMPLAERVRQLVAFEIDRDLASALARTAPPNVSVVEGDFLKVSAERLRALLHGVGPPRERLRVAGNLPYNVASRILFHLTALAAEGLPLSDATVMLQREVADRLTASPGSRDYGILTILIGRRAAAERVLALPPGAFRPPPRVRSALVRLRFRDPAPPAINEAVLATMVQALFTRRRKTLANALAAYPAAAAYGAIRALDGAGLAPGRRPETLSAAELVRLADVLASGD